MRRSHNEDAMDESDDIPQSRVNTNRHAPAPSLDPLSSPSNTSIPVPTTEPSHSLPGSPARRPQALLDQLEPFTFEWDDSESSIYDDCLGSDQSQYDYDSDDEDWPDYMKYDQSPAIENAYTSPPFDGGYQSGHEQFEEWEEHDGWRPMDEEAQQDESDRDLPEQPIRQSLSKEPLDTGIRREYHEHLNGAVSFSIFSFSTLTIGLSGIPCDIHGNFLPPGSSPPPRQSAALKPEDDAKDFKPYTDRLQFETADFLFTRNQMSARNIDTLLALWAASLAPYGDKPPFDTHKDLYSTIDSSSLGHVPWDSFSMRYKSTGPTQPGPPPAWQEQDHEVWFRDPRQLLKNMLSNPDFDGDFEYTPYHEYDADNNHRFQDFMSGDWAWTQAVSSIYLLCCCLLNRLVGSDC